MTDKINIDVSPKELEVLKEVLEGSDSDAPEVTAILDRLNDLPAPDVAAPPTAAETDAHTD